MLTLSMPLIDSVHTSTFSTVQDVTGMSVDMVTQLHVPEGGHGTLCLIYTRLISSLNPN